MLRQWWVPNLRGFSHSPCNLGTLRPHLKVLHTSALDRARRELGYERDDRSPHSLKADSRVLLEGDKRSDGSDATDLQHPPDLSFLYQDKPDKEIVEEESYTWSANSDFSKPGDIQREDSHSKGQIRSIGFVPNFKEALLGHAKRQIYRNVKTNDDAKRLQKTLWAKSSDVLGKSYITLPYALNALLARLHMVGCRPDRRAYLHGIWISAGYPLAMKMYLRRWLEDGPTVRTHTNAGGVPRVAEKVLADIACDLKGPWVDDRRRAQFLELLTGWIGQDRFPGQSNLRPPSLWHLMNKLDSEQWDAYLDLVHQVGGHFAIVREYEAFQAFSKRFLQYPPAWVKIELSGHVRRRPYPILNEMIPNAFIRALATDETWQMAWEVAYKVQERYEIEMATWVKLLAYPDGAREWTAVMKQAAVTMLDVETKKMEGILGVEWVGGEDGYHVTMEPVKAHSGDWAPRFFRRGTEKDAFNKQTSRLSMSDFDAERERLEEEGEAPTYVDEDE